MPICFSQIFSLYLETARFAEELIESQGEYRGHPALSTLTLIKTSGPHFVGISWLAGN